MHIHGIAYICLAIGCVCFGTTSIAAELCPWLIAKTWLLRITHVVHVVLGVLYVWAGYVNL